MAQGSRVFIGQVKTPGEHDAAIAEQAMQAQDAEARRLTLQMAVEQRKEQIAATRRKAEEDQFISEVSGQFKGPNGMPDFDKIAAAVSERYPERGLALSKQASEIRAQALKARKDELELEDLEMEVGASILSRMRDPQSFQQLMPRLAATVPELAQAVGTEYNADLIAKLLNDATPEKERIARQKEIAGNYAGDTLKAFLSEVALARSPKDYEDALTALELFKGPEVAQGYRTRLGEWGDDLPQRAQAMLGDQDPQRGGTSDYAQFLRSYAAEKGKTIETLTSAEHLDARKKYGLADNAAPRPLAPIVIQTAQGPMVTTGRDRQSVAPILGPDGKPVAPAPTATQRDRASGMNTATVVIDSIDELSEKINTQSGAVAKISGIAERARAQANLNDDLSEYNALVSGFIPLLARAVGHTGVLTQQDVDSVKAMLPHAGDSKSIRDRKMARIRSIMAKMPGGDGGGAEDGPADLVYDPKTKTFKRGGGE